MNGTQDLRAHLHDLVDDVEPAPDALDRIHRAAGADAGRVVALGRPHRRRAFIAVPLVAAAAAAVLVAVLTGKPHAAYDSSTLVVAGSAVIETGRTDGPFLLEKLGECLAATALPAQTWIPGAIAGLRDSTSGFIVAHTTEGRYGTCVLDGGKGIGLNDAGPVPAAATLPYPFYPVHSSYGPDGVLQTGGVLAPGIARVEVMTPDGARAEVDVVEGSYAVRITGLRYPVAQDEATPIPDEQQVGLRLYDASGALRYDGPFLDTTRPGGY